MDFLKELNAQLAAAASSSVVNLHGAEEEEEEPDVGSSVGHAGPAGVTMSEVGHVSRPRRDTASFELPVQSRPQAASTSTGGRKATYDPYAEAQRLDMARKAMMCVREIVRTERSYLAHLRSATERQVRFFSSLSFTRYEC